MPGVDTVHIGGGIGLCIAQLLGSLQDLIVGQALTGHVVQNVVAGTVHDAAHLIDGLDPAGTLQLTEPADAAADSSGGTERNALLLGQRKHPPRYL